MLLILLLACVPEKESAKPDSVVEVPDGWTLGEEQACAAPKAASWTQDALVVTYNDLAPMVHNEINPGALALFGQPGNFGLYWTTPTAMSYRKLGETGITDQRYTSRALAEGDLDGDGAMDLVMVLGAAGVAWGETELKALGSHREGAGPVDVAVGDLDGDGDLDLLVAWSSPDHSNGALMRGELIRNDGNRTFTSLDIDAPDDVWGPAFDFSIRDVDGDGQMDAYLCNDMGAQVAPNRLFLGETSGLVPHSGEGLDQRLSCMGSTWGDIDGDGVLELYISESVNHVLMKQDPDGNWYNISNSSGLTATFGEHTMSWGAAIADFDNNGRMELVDAIGDFWISGQEPNMPAWMELGEDGQFQDLSSLRGLPTETNARGVIAQDVNGDGVLDLIMGDANRSPWIFLSDGCTADAWLEVEGPIGSEVVVEAGEHTLGARIDTESGWGSAAPPVAHLGLAEAGTVDRIRLRLPGGEERVLEGPIAARRRIVFQE